MTATSAHSSLRPVLAVAAAVVVAFVLSSTYYSIFGDLYAALRPGGVAEPSPLMALAELGRSAVLATVLATAVARLRITTVAGALRLAALAFVGFPFVLLSGSVMWDGVPVALAGLHGGDWLIKLVVLSVLVVLVGRRPTLDGCPSRSTR